MASAVCKITAIFFVCFLLMAALHVAVPRLCLSRCPGVADTCPFCKLVFTLLIFTATVCLAGIRIGRLGPVSRTLHVFHTASRVHGLLRGPPMLFALKSGQKAEIRGMTRPESANNPLFLALPSHSLLEKGTFWPRS